MMPSEMNDLNALNLSFTIACCDYEFVPFKN